jgi:hypothetical protein
MLFPIAADGKYGFMDRRGEVLIAPSFGAVSRFSEGLSRATPELDIKRAMGDLEYAASREWGYIDTTGAWCVSPKTGWMLSDFSEGLACVTVSQEVGVIDMKGRVIAPLLHGRHDGGYSGGRALVVIDGKAGFLGRDGTLAIPATFAGARPFSEGLAAAYENGMWGYIDRSGEWTIRPRYREAYQFSCGLAHVVLFETRDSTFIDTTGEPVFDRHFNTDDLAGLRVFREGLLSVRQNGKWGFVGKTGDCVVHPRYDSIRGFSEGLAAVRSGDKWGYINLQGDVAIEPQFGRAWPFEHGLAAVEWEQVAGYVDTKGRTVWQTGSIEDRGLFLSVAPIRDE